MREQPGLTDKTIAAYCHYAADLLDEMTAEGSVDWEQLDASICAWLDSSFPRSQVRALSNCAGSRVIDVVSAAFIAMAP